MRFDFNALEAVTLPGLNGGTGTMTARLCPWQGGKLITCAIHPGGSIGLHAHPTSDDVNYVLAGEGTAECGGAEEPLSPGVWHVCPKGASHSIRNTGNEDLVLLTVVTER